MHDYLNNIRLHDELFETVWYTLISRAKSDITDKKTQL